MYYLLFLNVAVPVFMNRDHQLESMAKDLLRSILVNESRAYGFTIAFWGSGAILVGAFGIPDLLKAVLFGVGAVTGFGILTAWAYRGTLKKVDQGEPRPLALSMIHYIAAVLPVICTYLLTNLDPLPAFFFSGMSLSLTYNIGMLAEDWLSEEIMKFEEFMES